ncbi:MAG: sigma-54 dependent transcriptional regulator [Vicinamibacteria bacterium]|nr:sigma-54 dependent transcriptional regulator [Vicinamibacteria bacterium]
MSAILIVDDDESICTLLEQALAKPGRRVQTTTDDEEALALAEDSHFDVVLSDVNLKSRRNGIDVLKAFRARSPRTQVILMTGYGTVESAVEGVRAGAFDYLSKPFDVRDVIATVERALTSASEEAPKDAPLRAPMPVGLVGRTASMLAVYKQIAMAADAATPILIVGETGTGKELVARAIHSFGKVSGRPFEALNCAVVPETLLASELFGHVKGSFTGAVADKKGLFEVANGGTVFLDEIGETTPGLQVSLLRVLQEGEIRPVGGTRTVKVNARVLAATNRDLDLEVAEKRFRQDLFYRLSAFVIRVPPLRERREDIPLLVLAFLRNACARAGRHVELTPAAVDLLSSHSWPGNVRELENTIERLVLTTRSARVREEEVAEHFRGLVSPAARAFADLPSLEELERRYLIHVIDAAKGNRTRAAEILKIDRRTLYRMAARFGIELNADGDESGG